MPENRSLFAEVHLIGVAVIGGDEEDSVGRADRRFESRELQIDSFDRQSGRRQIPRVTDHIAVRQIQPNMLVLHGVDRGFYRIGDLDSLHLWPGVECAGVGWNFQVTLPRCVDKSRAISVEKVGYMSILLCFRTGELAQIVPDQVFSDGSVDCWRRDQLFVWKLQIAVVLHHACVIHSGSVRLWEH